MMRLEATGSSRLRRKDICVSISARCRSSEVEKSICGFVFATPDQDVKLAVGCAKGRLAQRLLQVRRDYPIPLRSTVSLSDVC